MSLPVLNIVGPDEPEHDSFAAYTRLITRKRDLEEELNDLEAQLKILEPQLLNFMGEAGYEMVRIGGYTLSPHREPWVYPVTGQSRKAICQVLKACGLAHYVNEQYSTKSLTKYVRDLEAEHQVSGDDVLQFVPEALARVIQIKPAYRLQARKR